MLLRGVTSGMSSVRSRNGGRPEGGCASRMAKWVNPLLFKVAAVSLVRGWSPRKIPLDVQFYLYLVV
jgi:hypothetical protein